MEKQTQDKKNTLGLIISIGIAFVAMIIGLVAGTSFGQSRSGNCSNDCSQAQNPQGQELAALPAPELTDGLRGEQFGIDKNINESSIDNYLNRSDSVYRDMRMLEDPGNYEAIGGDRYLSGFVRGFEVVPYPYLVNVSGLPAEVGATYTGTTLFTEKDGSYTANYEESIRILEDLFPKDKNIFLMCGGGGYAGMTKNLLIALGWDASRIYNVGGYWFYEGSENIPVKEELNGKTIYAFWKVPYHEIDFSKLTPKKK